MRYLAALALFHIVLQASSGPVNVDVGLPAFLVVECPQHKALTPELCVDVLFADGSHDMLLMFSPYEDAPTVLKGTLRSNPETKVVVILKDEVNPEATIVFKSPKAGGCTRFSADIEGGEDERPETTCIHRSNSYVDSPHDTHEHMPPNVTLPNERTEEEIALSPRALDTNGYRADVAVIYDDCFQREFGSGAATRVRAVMAIVDEMYSERESLETIIEWNTAAILYARGRDWCPVTDWSAIIRSDLANIARESGRDVDVFVFLTGSGSRDGLGLAWGIGTTCSSDKGQRINMNKYGPAGEFKGRDAYTAETIAHEIGHNLGMFHDFDDNSATREPRVLNGRQCWGYMDYEDGTHLGDHTNQWSHCSVSDFTRYVNRQNSFCLQSLGDGGGGGGGGNCVDKSGSCNWYANNNYCPAYPDWMLENCAKSCALCGGPPCVDKNEFCDWYADNNYCPRYPDWMQENCRRSCNLC